MSVQLLCDHFAQLLEFDYTLDPTYYQESTRRVMKYITSQKEFYNEDLDHVHRRTLMYCTQYFNGFQTMHSHTDDKDFLHINVSIVGSPASVYLVAYHIALSQETDMYISLKHFVSQVFKNLETSTHTTWDIIYDITMYLTFSQINAIQRRVLKCTSYGGIGRVKAFITQPKRIEFKRDEARESALLRAFELAKQSASQHDAQPQHEAVAEPAR